MSITMRNFFNIIIILCVCLDWGCAGEVHSHTIQLRSLFPSSSSSCVRSPKASRTKSSLHVVHKNGPCSRLRSRKPTSPDNANDILRRDQERMNFIHSKLPKSFANRIKTSQLTDLPAKPGSTIDSANYIVTLGIGTPQRDMSLIFDTGSDLTWIQCEPCAGSCYSQQEPKFDPASSSSYSNITCLAPECDSLTSADGVHKTCFQPTCGYGIQYGDGSITVGFLAKEKFTLKNSDVFEGVIFGCGEKNQGLFRGAAGLLGLGRNKISFPSQATSTYNNIFSYCLPSSGSYTGHLTFGSAGISNSAKFTPITSKAGASFYGIDFEGITVGDTKLDIPLNVFSDTASIIDSGTVITRLPPRAYEALRNAFKEKMSNYKSTEGVSLLDTCYDFTGMDTVTIPTMSFTFGGGAVVELGAEGVMIPFSVSKVCLAFTSDDELTTFGNVQQKTLDVVYDVAGGRIGFSPNGCS